MSISCASAAGRMRAASLWSRRRRSVASASPPISGRSARRRCARTFGIGDEIDLHLRVGRDDGADVASLDDDVAVVTELALALAHDLAHLRMARDDRHHPVDLRAADRGGDVGAGDEDAAVVLEGDRVLAARAAPRRSPSERSNARLQREPRERAVHRAGVEVAEAGAARRAAARPCSCPRRRARRLRRSSSRHATPGGRRSRGSL